MIHNKQKTLEDRGNKCKANQGRVERKDAELDRRNAPYCKSLESIVKFSFDARCSEKANLILRDLKNLPEFEFACRLRSMNYYEECVVGSKIENARRMRESDDCWNKVSLNFTDSCNRSVKVSDRLEISEAPAGSDCELELTITTVRGKSGDKVYSPRYHKPKSMDWWLVLSSPASAPSSVPHVESAVTAIESDGGSTGAEAENEELVALKRVGALQYRRSVQTLQFSVGDETGLQRFRIRLMSDCIFGLDVSMDFLISIS